jgi:hypothetical protein
MLFRHLLNDQLEKKRDDFVRFFDEQSVKLGSYSRIIGQIEAAGYEELRRRWASVDDIGAFPADELERIKSFTAGFDHAWQNHEQARRWAAQVLDGRTTFAADGSQIYAAKETTLPVAAVQIGWFENPHDETLSFEKNATFELLSPEDLLKDQEEPMNPETRVGERRFHAEVDKAAEFLSKRKGWRERGERMPLAFFDGTLLVSFSLPQTTLQESFISAMVDLVRHSRDCEVPVIGFVDRSFARDLLTFFDAFDGRGQTGDRTLYDAAVLSGGILSGWGERTCFCYSKRRGLGAFNDADGKSIVGFSYLRLTFDGPPARLDIPSWIYEARLLDEVIDVVRAESVVGLGYPYALETADQAAVISTADRNIFLRALQGLASREKLNFSVARKAASKGRRR